MKQKYPIESVSANRKLLFTEYKDRVVVSPVPRGSYGNSQIAHLPVRPDPKPWPREAPPTSPKTPTARQILRQSLGLDSIAPKPN